MEITKISRMKTLAVITTVILSWRVASDDDSPD